MQKNSETELLHVLCTMNDSLLCNLNLENINKLFTKGLILIG